jgi:CheY-like chemotaxis protein
VKSILGRGTTFSIELPMKIGKAEHLPEEEVAIEASEIPQGIKALVVDDNYINRLLVIHLLQSKGFDVLEAASGYEALDILREEDIDIVLMDISMPDMDGFETTKIIRKSEPAYIRNVPVIAMTAHGFQEQIKDAREAGMNDYIVKPFKPDQLYKIILKQLNEGEQRHPEMKTAHEKLYDLAFLEDYYDHEESLINNILSLYLKDTPGSVLLMQEFVDKQDWLNLKAQAHKIKTNMMMMGIRHLDEFFKESSALNPSEPRPEKVVDEFQRFKDIVGKAMEQIKVDRNLVG